MMRVQRKLSIKKSDEYKREYKKYTWVARRPFDEFQVCVPEVGPDESFAGIFIRLSVDDNRRTCLISFQK